MDGLPSRHEGRVRGTIGGDQIDYPGVTAAFTAGLETIRILLNATASEGARFFTADIKDFYLGTPLTRKEYMRVSIKHIPLDIQQKYNMAPLIHDSSGTACRVSRYASTLLGQNVHGNHSSWVVHRVDLIHVLHTTLRRVAPHTSSLLSRNVSWGGGGDFYV